MPPFPNRRSVIRKEDAVGLRITDYGLRTQSPMKQNATTPRRFGAHMMIAGGLHKAVEAGAKAGCDVIQIFTKSPQQWKAKALTEEEAEAFREAQAEAGIPCVAAHDTYLINPASADPDLLARSRA